MYIKEIKKKNTNSDKIYTYYRLVHSYKLGNKIRHRNIVGLGKLENIDKEHHKTLADRIEEIITGNSSLLFADTGYPKEVETTAQFYADKIIKEKLFTDSRKVKSLTKEVERNYQNIDVETIEQIESKDIGGEWLVKQVFDSIGVDEILQSSGLSSNASKIAQLLLTAKLLHPSSERETERWLKENSAAGDLYPIAENISRYKLYKVATSMYEAKDYIESSLYDRMQDIFSGRNKIVIFDLTNMYFQGQMNACQKAEFGRSKQKQKDRKLIGLALSIDSLGFVRYSRFYPGNVSEPQTFETMLKDISSQLPQTLTEKPLVVMDAGISTEENLSILRSEEFNYDYVCVSRTKPNQYEILSESHTVTDNRDHEINLTKVSVPSKDDFFLHIKSDQKQKKEESIDKKLSNRLEHELQEIKEKLSQKRTMKKSDKIHEKVGRIKEKLSKIGYLYNIEYTEDKEKGIITDIQWNRIKTKERPKGEYFLRYTKEAVSEQDIWDTYNLTRDIEAVFRVLKTDLDIRPIYHQKDAYIEPHIWLGILAYQTVNFTRKRLKENGIHYCWTTIKEKLRSMQSSIVMVDNDKNEKLYVKLCTRPTKDQKEIFSAFSFKERPFVRKTKLVPQM